MAWEKISIDNNFIKMNATGNNNFICSRVCLLYVWTLNSEHAYTYGAYIVMKAKQMVGWKKVYIYYITVCFY